MPGTSTAVDWATAVGTCGAVIVALWVAIRDGRVRAREQVRRNDTERRSQARLVVIPAMVQGATQTNEWTPGKPSTDHWWTAELINGSAEVIRYVDLAVTVEWAEPDAVNRRETAIEEWHRREERLGPGDRMECSVDVAAYGTRLPDYRLFACATFVDAGLVEWSIDPEHLLTEIRTDTKPVGRWAAAWHAFWSPDGTRKD